MVIKKAINAKRGVNTIDISSNDFSGGVYLYSISNGENMLTKRMIISK